MQYTTTCDIFRQGNATTTPNVSATPCSLSSQFNQSTSTVTPGNAYTHILLCAADTDIRDSYAGGNTHVDQDTVWIPDRSTGTSFKVRFSTIIGRGSSNPQKQVYLDRQTPTWPTNEI